MDRVLLLAVSLALAFPAFAASPGGGPSEGLFFAQILLLIVSGRLLGEAMQRWGQPAVMGQLLAGVVLGPSVFGALAPDLQHMLFPKDAAQNAMINGVAQLGILLLLVLAGMETELQLVRRIRGTAISVSLAGIVLPFACGFALGEMLPDSFLPDPERRLATSVFLGTALSISSVKIVATVVREMNFVRRTIGQVILASAIIDDTLGWIIIALTFGLAANSTIDVTSLGVSVGGTLVFLVFSFTLGRRMVIALIRWTNDSFVSELPVVSAILAIMAAMALVTHGLGVHSVLGAFIAGILIGESPILTRRIDQELRGLTQALFMPIFFGLAGLGTDLSILSQPSLLLLALGFIAIASVGKFVGAFAGGRWAGLSNRECFALGCGMNARGSTEVIVATIGLQMGVLDQNLFSIIVAMAVVTTMAMPPSLRWALARLPMRPEERERLEREAFEEKSWLGSMERLLLAVDKSSTGRIAAELAGLFAGLRAMPVSIVDLADGEAPATPPAFARSSDATPEDVKETVKHAADAATPAERDPADIHVDRVEQVGEAKETIEQAGSKGFDLLMIGVEPNAADDGRITPNVSELAGRFEASLAILCARGALRQHGKLDNLRILVPVTGAETARRGAEFALALAAAARGSVTALAVEESAHATRPRTPRLADSGEAVRAELAAMADHYGVKLDTLVRTSPSAETAILHAARQGRYDLIVLGVGRRAGAGLAFGHVSEALLAMSERSLLFFAPRSQG